MVKDDEQFLLTNWGRNQTFCRPSRTVCRFLFRISSLDSYFILRSGTTAIRLKRMSWYGSLKKKVKPRHENKDLRIWLCWRKSLVQWTGPGPGLTLQWPVQFSPWLPSELYPSIPPPLPKALKHDLQLSTLKVAANFVPILNRFSELSWWSWTSQQVFAWMSS